MAKQRDKQGLRPVQDVVGRLRFDPAFDVRRFVVGYEERFAGVREAPLADFLAGDNEIPWHRIFFIKAGELVVWDRRARIDLVFGSGDSAAPDHPAIARACAPAPTSAPAPTTRRGKSRAPARPESHRLLSSPPQGSPSATHPGNCEQLGTPRISPST